MKKKDKIDMLIEAYENTSTGRIKKKKDAKEKKEIQEKARAKFEKEAEKMIAGLIRPVMIKLLNRMKNGFRYTHSKWGSEEHLKESFDVKGRKEDIEIYFSFDLVEDFDEIFFGFGYSMDEEDEIKQFDDGYALSEVTEKSITEYFIKAMDRVIHTGKKQQPSGGFMSLNEN